MKRRKPIWVFFEGDGDWWNLETVDDRKRARERGDKPVRLVEHDPAADAVVRSLVTVRRSLNAADAADETNRTAAWKAYRNAYATYHKALERLLKKRGVR